MQAVLGELEALGATLAAMTPQLVEHNRAMRDRHAINFQMLTDPANAYAAELGLRFEVPDALKEVYAARGVHLPRYNGESSWTLPVPARLVVDGSGVIRAADVDVDYTRRPEPEKALEDVRAIV